MARNIEIKARTSDPLRLRSLVESIADSGPTVIEQKDTFFNCPDGRLKLRTFSDDTGELIYYEREDSIGPTESKYIRSLTDRPGSLEEALRSALGVRAVVCKRRELYMIGQTRVHLDEVDELGSFVELEVVLSENQSAEAGVRIAQDLMKRLEIQEADLQELAYVDLLLKKSETVPPHPSRSRRPSHPR